jgi:hypothetical protein
MLAQMAAAAQEFEIVKALATKPGVRPVVYLETTSRAAAFAGAARSLPDLST